MIHLLHNLSHQAWAFLATAAALVFLTINRLLPLTMLTNPAFSRLTQTDLRRAEISLSSTQILNLNATPIQVVPAPGAGLRIVPYLCVVHYFGGTVAYTNGGGGFPELLVGSAAYVFTDAAIFLVTVAPNRRSQSMGFAEVLDTAANPPTSENAALTISKATAEFAAGNGTARVAVYYTIENCNP